MISKFSLCSIKGIVFSIFKYNEVKIKIHILGDIKILSQSKSFHPVQSIPSVTANHISLPDLSEVNQPTNIFIIC